MNVVYIIVYLPFWGEGTSRSAQVLLMALRSGISQGPYEIDTEDSTWVGHMQGNSLNHSTIILVPSKLYFKMFKALVGKIVYVLALLKFKVGFISVAAFNFQAEPEITFTYLKFFF